MSKNATLYRESQFAAICEAIAGRAIAAKDGKNTRAGDVRVVGV